MKPKKKKYEICVWKEMWENEKMLVTRLFFFSHDVFKSFLSQGLLDLELFLKGLNKFVSYGYQTNLEKHTDS